MHGRAFYDAVGDALTGFLPPSLRDFGCHRSSYNLKLWYGDGGEESREHYEVQLIKWQRKVGLEIGFHAEHREASRNTNVVEKLMSAEKDWRKSLGKDPEAGPFLGQQAKVWTRISEFWDGADGGDDPDLAIDAAERLASYIKVFEPLRQGS
jgi:hypothetical protein